MITTTTKNRSISSMIILILLAFCCQTAIAGGKPLIETNKKIYKNGKEAEEDLRIFKNIKA